MGFGFGGVGQDDFAEAEDGAVDGVDDGADDHAEDEDGDGFEDFIDLSGDGIEFVLIIIGDFVEHGGGGTGFGGDLENPANGATVGAEPVAFHEECFG